MTNDHDGGPVSNRARDVSLIVLVCLAIGGIAVMDFTTDYGFWYWLIMVPVFGCVGVFLAARAHQADPDRRPLLLRRQILHWAVAIVGILITFLMLDSGTFNRSAAALVALLVLSLATIMAGVHFEWRLAVLGVILAVTLVLAVLAEHFFWLLLPLALVAVVLLWRRRSET